MFKKIILNAIILAILGVASAQAVKISGTFTLADGKLKVPAGGTAYVDGQAYGPGTYPWPPNQNSIPSSIDNQNTDAKTQKTKTLPHTFDKNQKSIQRDTHIIVGLTLIGISLTIITIYVTIKTFQEWQKNKEKHEQSNDNDSPKKLSTI